MIPESWQAYIETETKKGHGFVSLLNEIHFHCTAYYKDDGFRFSQEAEQAFGEFAIACQIRTYCRRHGLTTRKGSLHAIDCRREHVELWGIVRAGDMEGCAAGLRWWYRAVDQLKNLYIQF